MNKEKGFALIELLIVLIIAGILAAVAVPEIQTVMARAKENVVKGNAHYVQYIADDYAIHHNGIYPTLKELQAIIENGKPLKNPFTQAIETVRDCSWSQGSIGYSLISSGYRIEGYGETSTSGAYQNGIIVLLEGSPMNLTSKGKI